MTFRKFVRQRTFDERFSVAIEDITPLFHFKQCRSIRSVTLITLLYRDLEVFNNHFVVQVEHSVGCVCGCLSGR